MKTTSRIFAVLAALLISVAAWADRTAGEHIDDSAVQAEVKAKLMGDDFFGGAGANIEIHKGVVQLGGWVDSAEEAAKAGEIAAAVDGVVEVDNQLHVKRGEASMGQVVDDKVITTRTKSAIGELDLGTGFDVNVDTYNGVVLLTGFVHSAETRAACGELAAQVDNVEDVVNGIYVYE
ncbi:MAG: BON domain-containing protein [Xanthomonadales bacterium]